jgi:ankyrin repeat protein
MSRLDQHPTSRLRARLDAETAEFSASIFHLVRTGDAPRLLPLLERGIDPDLRDAHGDSLLMQASEQGQLDVARVLLEFGAAPDLANHRGQTALAGAALKDDPEMVELLLTHGADVDVATPEGQTVLMLAAMHDRAELVDVLLTHGAAPDARDPCGLTARDYAKRMGANAAMERLAEA